MTGESAEQALDAYQTRKPDEPVFTLQGGDPLAPPVIEIWACAARVRAGAIPPSCLTEETLWTKLQKAAAETSVANKERDRDNLLIRATAAEEVAWHFTEYQHGAPADAKSPEKAGKNFLDEKARLELFDIRVLAASRLSNMFSELTEIKERLEAAGFDGADNLWLVKTKVCIANLTELETIVEPEIRRQRYARKG